MNIAFYTLGCKLNFAETSTLQRTATNMGHKVVDFSEFADVYVINTCTVTDVADKKCRNIIRRAVNKNAKVIVTGCYAQVNPNEISEIKGVDLIISNNDKNKFSEYLNSIEQKQIIEISYNNLKNENNLFFPAYSIGNRTRSFLKVQDGCNYYCSYCTIPFARGKSRNAKISDIVTQANEIAQKGIKEIVLTGINIGDFGHTTGESLIELINKLDEVNGIERYRISSIEPDLLTNEIINFVKHSKKFVPHFHIPLQSGSDKILNLMKRKYDTSTFKQKINYILSEINDICIGIDVIVGFPGETEFEFNETVEFIKDLNVAYLHVFTYSERENTLSAKYNDKVEFHTKENRSKLLHVVGNNIKEKYYNKFINKEAKVLFENKNKDGKISGFTSNYIKVETTTTLDIINKILGVKLVKYNKSRSSFEAVLIN